MAGRGDGQTRSNGQQRAACRDLACRRHRQDHPERGVENPVLVDGIGRAKIVTLNRPKQLNALSFQMVSELLRLFVAYENDPGVKLVILKGKGRAFCAGGDVSAVVHSINEDSWKAGAQFFWNEFILNYIIATYSKPQVSILDGIVFGGGAGVSIHGMFRIATENSVFAMPETALGLFPDIGASYFLSRLPGYFGEYVGLTGVRLDGAEMLVCGLATHFVSSKVLPLLEESLVSADTSDLSAISAVIDKFSEKVPLPKGCAYRRLDVIDRCFSKGSVEEIIVALMEEFDNNDDEWIRNALQSLKKASPCSLKITLRSIREGRMQGIGECLKTDYRMCCHVLRKDVSKDFFEGCRAILIDKDKNPKWEPSSLELVTDEMVDYHFAEVNDDEWEDLRFPHRWSSKRCGFSRL